MQHREDRKLWRTCCDLARGLQTFRCAAAAMAIYCSARAAPKTHVTSTDATSYHNLHAIHKTVRAASGANARGRAVTRVDTRIAQTPR
eukprot:828684-Lingulodinium_polyedra.AAC.1